jgi:hypothetical protein
MRLPGNLFRPRSLTGKNEICFLSCLQTYQEISRLLYCVKVIFSPGFDKSPDTDIMGEQIAPYKWRLK